MKITNLLVAAALACLIGSGIALAETAATPAAPAAKAATPPPAAAAPPAAKPDAKAKRDEDADPDKTAISAKCSAEATKRGLHGKPRKTFRSKCKKSKGKV